MPEAKSIDHIITTEVAANPAPLTLPAVGTSHQAFDPPHRNVPAAHRHVVPAHQDERRTCADERGADRPVADQLDHLPVLPASAGENILANANAARNFGLAPVYPGVAILVLRQERQAMTDGGPVHAQSGFPVSFTLVAAFLFLAVMAGAGLTFHNGPFQ
jgi:hypothetical protein